MKRDELEDKLITVGELIDILLKYDSKYELFLSDPSGFYLRDIRTNETIRIDEVKHW